MIYFVSYLYNSTNTIFCHFVYLLLFLKQIISFYCFCCIVAKGFIVAMFVTTDLQIIFHTSNIQYVCYAINRSANCQPLTQYTICMLRYIPQ